MSVSPLPNVAALLAKATPGPWATRERDYRVLTNVGEAYPAGTGRFGYWDDAQLAGAAPSLAAALVEAADALRYYAEGETDASGKLAQRTLARLVAFDASLKETTE